MKFRIKTIFLVLFITFINWKLSLAQAFHFPETNKISTQTVYCDSLIIKDNYRWLENLNDSTVKKWFSLQGAYFEKMTNRIPLRDSLLAAMYKIEDQKNEVISQLTIRNNKYFFVKAVTGDNVGKLYFRKGELGSDELLFDPSIYEKGRTFNISFILPSLKGEKIALGIAEGGSEISRILVMNVESKTLYKESIYPSWFGAHDWNNEGTAFYYTAHETMDPQSPGFAIDTKLMLHQVGTAPEHDKEIFSRIHNPELAIDSISIIEGVYSSDRKYFLIFQGGGQYLDMFCTSAHSLMNSKIEWKHIIKKEDEIKNFCINGDSIFILKAGNGQGTRVIATAINNPDFIKARVVIPADRKSITNIDRTKNYMFIEKSDGINKTVLQYSFLTGKISSLKPPRMGNLSIGPLNIESDQIILSLSSWTHMPQLLKYNPDNYQFERSVFDRSVDLPEMENVTVSEIEVRGHDGVMIPLSIVYPKNMKMDGTTYCVMTGYGAYGYSLEPNFSAYLPFFFSHRIIYAVAHVRGGGEKGEDWHKGGFKKTKPNSWNDFISCAEYLIKQKYTASSMLVATGGSAGGILVGRAITERPELFGGAIIAAGDCNTILTETTQTGPDNIPEFGSVKNSEDCKSVVEMDALSHVKEGVKYPAILCSVGMNDHRVEPWSSGKFVAALQNATSSGKPVMLRVDYDNGHFTDDRSVDLKQKADIYSYIFWAIGHPDFKMK